MTPFTAEILGTMLMILLGNGVVSNVLLDGTKGHGSGWMVITTAWALAVYVGVVVAGPYSGAHINPVVSISLALAGKFAWSQVPLYIAAQFIGAMLGAALTWFIHRDHFAATHNPIAKLACFCTAPAIHKPVNNLISEAAGAFVLIITILFLVGPSITLEGGGEAIIGLGSLGALPVALLVWVIGLSLGGTTGYAINPARDLAPRIVHALLPIEGSSDWSYAWIPVIGPICGGAIAAGVFLILS